MIAQDRNCAIGRLLCGGSDNYYSAALFDVIGVKFLFADVVWLFAGKVARFAFFERAAGTEQTPNPVAMWLVGLRGRLARGVAVRASSSILVITSTWWPTMPANSRSSTAASASP